MLTYTSTSLSSSHACYSDRQSGHIETQPTITKEGNRCNEKEFMSIRAVCEEHVNLACSYSCHGYAIERWNLPTASRPCEHEESGPPTTEWGQPLVGGGSWFM
ncbi:hypothetical protein M758_5G085700 [Ceratodon purpureus]|nr:hypothetical protein M758_5G085700 [Ceratodon purpureus]